VLQIIVDDDLGKEKTRRATQWIELLKWSGGLAAGTGSFR